MLKSLLGELEEHHCSPDNHECKQWLDVAEHVPECQYDDSAQRITDRSTHLDHDTILPAREGAHEIADKNRKIHTGFEIDRHTDKHVTPAHLDENVCLGEPVQHEYFKPDHQYEYSAHHRSE